MTDAPELSVVTVTHECRDHVMNLLNDLSAARESVELDVHLVDNASTDGTVESVREKHPWVSVEGLAENGGFARANNRAIRRALAPILLILNPDTRITGDALRACVDHMHSVPAVGILTPRVVAPDGRLDRRCMRGFPTLWSVFCHLTGLDTILRDRRSRRYLLRWLTDDEPADVEAVSGAVMFIRASAIHEAGGFDERFFMYGEDIDLCTRIMDAGWRVRYWPRASLVHVGGGSGRNDRSRRAWATALGQLHRHHGRGAGRVPTGRVFDIAALVVRGADRVRRLQR